MKMVPCPECHRHLHAAEERCPFCDAPLAFVPLAASAPRGLSRAHRYALNAALATGLAAASCGGDTTTSGGDAAVAEGGGAEGGSDAANDTANEASGDAAQDAAQDTGIADAAEEPDGRVCCPPYGCVFPDACGPVRV
jgi:hypothetical protein